MYASVCFTVFFGSITIDGWVEGVPYRFQEYSSYTVAVCFISEGTTGYSDIAVNYSYNWKSLSHKVYIIHLAMDGNQTPNFAGDRL